MNKVNRGDGANLIMLRKQWCARSYSVYVTALGRGPMWGHMSDSRLSS